MISIGYLSLTHRTWKIQQGWKISISCTQTDSVSLWPFRALPHSQVNLSRHKAVSQLPSRIERAATKHLPQVQPTDLVKGKYKQWLNHDSNQPRTLLLAFLSTFCFTSQCLVMWCQASFSRPEKHRLKEKPDKSYWTNVLWNPFKSKGVFSEICLLTKMLQ